VKVWFQNRRSKIKKLLKAGSIRDLGDNAVLEVVDNQAPDYDARNAETRISIQPMKRINHHYVEAAASHPLRWHPPPASLPSEG